MKNLATVIFMSLILNVLGCGAGAGKRSKEGVERVSVVSPDGATRVFVWKPTMEKALGATVSQVFEVWLQGVGNIKAEQQVLAADKTTGFEFRWSSPTNLDVCYVKAQIYEFRNSINLVSVELQTSYNIEVDLRKVNSLDECKS